MAKVQPRLQAAAPALAVPAVPTAREPFAWAVPVALALSMVLWGSSHPALKLALRELTPPQVTFVRVTAAGVMLLVLVVLTGRTHLILPQLRSPLSPLVGAVFGYALTMNLSAYALSYVPAAVNALLINISPIFTALLGAAFLGEAISRRIGVGIVVGFLGVGLVTLAGQEMGGIGLAALPGVVIGLGGALVWAIYTVGMRRFAHHTVDPLVATALAALGAAIPLGLLAGPFATADTFIHVSLAAQVALIWTGAMSSGVSFVVWAWALKRASAGRVATYQYLVAPVALLLAWPILGEAPSVLLVFGMALVLAGVAAAQRR
jgi:drug/metabolite transporter (DMT)-like permease